MKFKLPLNEWQVIFCFTYIFGCYVVVFWKFQFESILQSIFFALGALLLLYCIDALGVNAIYLRGELNEEKYFETDKKIK